MFLRRHTSKLAIWAAGLAIATVAIILAPHKVFAAETGGYPYAAKPCVHAPYAVTGSSVQWCGGYDWGDKPNDTSAANVISPYGYYYRNCTDYVAWRLAGQGIAVAQYKGLGNAKAWASPAAGKGLRVDAIPSAGAAAVRTTGTWGHVAYVEAVHADGTITVAQYNEHGDGTFSVDTGTAGALGFTRFVHFEVYMPASGTTEPVGAPAPLAQPEPVPVVAPVAAVAAAPLPATEPEPGEPGSYEEAAESQPMYQPQPQLTPDIPPEVQPLPPRAAGLQPPHIAIQPVVQQRMAAPATVRPAVPHQPQTAPPPDFIPPPSSKPVVQAALTIPATAVPARWWQQPRGSPPSIGYVPATQKHSYHPMISLTGLVLILVMQAARPVKMFTVRSPVSVHT